MLAGFVRVIRTNPLARPGLVFCAQNADGDDLSNAAEMTLATNPALASFSAGLLGPVC